MSNMDNEYIRALQSKLRLKEGISQNLRPSQWIQEYTSIVTQGETTPFSFNRYEFQKKIVDCDAREVVFKKCCQIGATELFVRFGLEMVANRGYTVILTQPDFEGSRNFAKSRINPVIEKSPMLKSMVKNSNSVNLKEIGDAFLFVKYTKGSESHALSVPADVLISDEVDQSDLDQLALFSSRLENSTVRMTRHFGTPTIPEYGISNMFDVGNQWVYMVKCPHCGHWNHPDIHNLIGFPIDNFLEGLPSYPKLYREELTEAAEHVYIGCSKCSKSLEYADRLNIPQSSNLLSPVEPKYEWVNVTNESTSSVMAFSISQLSTGLKSGNMVLTSMKSYRRMRDIYNQILGEPFISSVDSLTESDISFLEDNVSPSTTIMGMDFGVNTYVTIIREDEVDDFCIVVDLFVLPLFTPDKEDNVVDEALRIAEEYGVIMIGMDAMPYQNSVNKMKKRSKVPVVDFYLTDRARTVTNLDVNKMTIVGNRTAAIDDMLSRFKAKKVVFNQKCLKYENELKLHFTRFKRVVKNDDTYFYPSMKPDHFGFAYMYASRVWQVAQEYPDVFHFGGNIELEGNLVSSTESGWFK